MKLKQLSKHCKTLFLVLLPVAICIACNKENRIALGENYEGGIVFYIDGTGNHGLVAAPKDQGYFPWGCTLTNITGADESAIGKGKQNTIDIINGCSESNFAAYVCANLELNGYSDWFLPSKDELNFMYINLGKQNLGNFKKVVPIFTWYDAVYWSSTEVDSKNPELEVPSAWNQNFKTGGQSNGYSKNNACYVRAIRAF